ncbi:MAG TPA: hypothetical protein DCQ26_09180 [Marinilabiliales bacterium]|jgi:hypothetical protein|nr:MAG: hypothetical protein A2W84_17440 [Bacteroidetes bacterium GWC2_40_13]OFX76253.1 MAG: hypothetical protein A2W96_03440 [Bacteroidetes bacterium GWD2_40_43]OFX95774.1 MAG: hypothetical protein A2W97_15890 [Bacteroidetes bacterium GWE2_40_63]OFY21737.1 MAG: hypothetical protein A2W88_05845 [Bacteroidetes bacterium GWF2_40_13]OFZ23921.1 MAG: hypothetical protein A2437_10285 [Bacteroidetes bacterium RIFOXYC2_FULL_40_12]HAM98768.1 hypothetical protein [Marinilabiliales bacterium]
MEITGKIVQILPATGGQSAKGGWKRQDFIIETVEQYPKKVCISNWNDKVELTQQGIGAQVKASINIESREFNGKWYTDVRVWKMETMGGARQADSTFDTGNYPPPPSNEELGPDDMPF